MQNLYQGVDLEVCSIHLTFQQESGQRLKIVLPFCCEIRVRDDAHDFLNKPFHSVKQLREPTSAPSKGDNKTSNVISVKTDGR